MLLLYIGGEWTGLNYGENNVLNPLWVSYDRLFDQNDTFIFLVPFVLCLLSVLNFLMKLP